MKTNSLRKPITKSFVESIYSLSVLSEEIAYHYEAVRSIVSQYKKNGTRFIGNPYIKIQGRFLELTYLTKIHILNCRVYHDLLFEDVDINHDLQMQLKSLLEITSQLFVKFENLKIELEAIPTSSEYNNIISYK